MSTFDVAISRGVNSFLSYWTKTQLINHCTFQSVTEAEQALFHYIEIYYNPQRKHSTNWNQ